MDTQKPVTSGLLFDDLEIVCVFDGFEPRLASIVCETIGELSEETITLLWNLKCRDAYEETCWN